MSERTWVITGIALLIVLLGAGWVITGGLDALDAARGTFVSSGNGSVEARVPGSTTRAALPKGVAQAPSGLADRLRGGAVADPTLALASFDSQLSEYSRLARVATDRAGTSAETSAAVIAEAGQRVNAMVEAHRADIERGTLGRTVARNLVRKDWQAFVASATAAAPEGEERDALAVALREVGGPVSAP